MARRKNVLPATDLNVQEYRHDAKRKNNPPAALAAQGKMPKAPKIKYAYNPHLQPELRSDPTGAADQLPALIATAGRRTLSAAEQRILADALRHHEPWIEWSGKREQKEFVVDPVALHIHERVSTHAILQAVQREQPQRSLFADPEQPYNESLQFYRHDVDWSNRMILGDSLQVMASLARREDLAGKVQMIYMDPPYGIKFGSNFQPEIGKRDVKDKESDLTREPEMVKAYRDTWTLGVHSYLAYLRDRLTMARELLADTGSIFVQISDENLHRVRMLMDEVFGSGNFMSLISYATTGGFETSGLSRLGDYILWYAREKEKVKYRQLFTPKSTATLKSDDYRYLQMPDGSRRVMTQDERDEDALIPKAAKVFRFDNTTSQDPPPQPQPFEHEGKVFHPSSGRHWTANWPQGMRRLAGASRLFTREGSLALVRYLDDFVALGLTNMWGDTSIAGTREGKLFVVQTNPKVIERCLLMTTDPGDLVLDPTCGSGTTAYVAEQWGRRWITIDTSRVALSLARQRLLTANYLSYNVKKCDSATADQAVNPANGFVYKKVPHITLKSIAQNVALDAIFNKHQPILDKKLQVLNARLGTVGAQLRSKLAAKLALKEKQSGKKSITVADRRRWLLPKGTWQEWEVPFDTDSDWPQVLQQALQDYRKAWRAKMDEVNAAIAANAESEELVDQPEVITGVARVSGPFTMEAVMPAEQSLDDASPADGESEDLPTFDADIPNTQEPANAEAYVDRMLRLMRGDGVRFPNNNVVAFTRLDPFGGEYIQAEGEWKADGSGLVRTVAISLGPEHGPITAYQVENAIHQASRRGFDDVVFAGFSFDAAAQATIQDDPNPRVKSHMTQIAPDVNMGDLLKATPNSQLFTVFGSPRTTLEKKQDGEYTIAMEGVDVYNPVTNTLIPTGSDKVAAWFVDSDYDGHTFCITQAFFPDKSAWDKIARALNGSLDEESFAAMSGTTSLPFRPGKHNRAAVKVIDPRGNEVMRIHPLSNKAS